MTRFLVVLILLAFCERSLAAEFLLDQNPVTYTVQPDSEWHLIGRWNNPPNADSTISTKSIVQVGDTYVEIYSPAQASISSGCCYWPTGSRLERMSKSSFFNNHTKRTLTINDDGSLTVFEHQGATLRLLATPSFVRPIDEQ